MATSTRHKNDLACEQCRRRKSKCDRIQPQCGSCARADTTCVFVDERPKRGPKKGQLRALKDQVAALERQLAAQNSIECHQPQSQQGEETCLLEVDELDQTIHHNVNMAGTAGWLDDDLAVTGWDDQLFEFPEADASTSEPSSLSSIPDILSLSDMVRADLDALYFERVHPFAPIIHKLRYFSWADQESPSLVHTSLRLAMWTLAAAISTQFQGLSHRLYAATRQALHRLDGNDRDVPWTTGDIQLEEIQAWLLLAYYEFIRMERHHVLLTASRAFRLVQLTQLHSVDALGAPAPKGSRPASPDTPESSGDPMSARLEEKRRTFWLAFCFDRILNAHDSLTFTLQEEVIYVLLPATEACFQTSQQCRRDLLSEAIMDSNNNALTSFAENVVLAALYGRCLTHRRLAIATALNGNKVSAEDSGEFLRRHEWLAAALERRIAPLAEINLDPSDPLATFNHLLGRSAIIYLSDTAATWPRQSPEHHLLITAFEQRAYQAATEIVHLTCALPRLTYVKAYPFLPSTLAHTIAFLKRQAEELHSKEGWEGGKDCHAERLLACLRRFSDVYPSVRELIEKLEGGVKYIY